MYDIIIIGAGPAGLSAALYARRAGKSVLILEKSFYGGQIIEALRVENYPGIKEISGVSFAENLYEQAISLGCEIKYLEVLKITDTNRVITDKEEFVGKAIIIACGLTKRKLGLPLEDKFIGGGISYCATCDGAFYKDMDVAVLGGGNTALEDALYLSNICRKVYLIHRRDKFRGDKKYQDEVLKRSNISLLLNTNVTKLIGDDLLSGIEISKVDKSSVLEISGLFVAIGMIPNTKFLEGFIELDRDGFILSDDGIHTNRFKIYVAGDVREKMVRQLATAVGDGCATASCVVSEMED